jgi:hypothetical protein
MGSDDEATHKISKDDTKGAESREARILGAPNAGETESESEDEDEGGYEGIDDFALLDDPLNLFLNLIRSQVTIPQAVCLRYPLGPNLARRIRVSFSCEIIYVHEPSAGKPSSVLLKSTARTARQ